MECGRRRKHGENAPVYPRRTKRACKWKERRWAGHWGCATCAANLGGVAPDVAKAILAKHARCILPKIDDPGDTFDSDGITDYDDNEDPASANAAKLEGHRGDEID